MKTKQTRRWRHARRHRVNQCLFNWTRGVNKLEVLHNYRTVARLWFYRSNAVIYLICKYFRKIYVLKNPTLAFVIYLIAIEARAKCRTVSRLWYAWTPETKLSTCEGWARWNTQTFISLFSIYVCFIIALCVGVSLCKWWQNFHERMLIFMH